MTQDLAGLAATAARLRQAFDRSFAEAVRTDIARFDDLLAIRLGGDRFAVRLSALSGLLADKKVTPLPGPVPELLGVVGLRSAIVPVYDLGAFCGYPPAASHRWLALANAGANGVVVGLAFDQLEGYLRLAPEALVPDRSPEGVRRHVREVVQSAEDTRPVVDVASVLEAIKTRAHQAVGSKEP